MDQTSFIQLGYIQDAFGIKGWLKVFSYCRPRAQILDYKTWQLRTNSNENSYLLQQGKQHGNRIIAKLSGIDTRTQAETLAPAEIWVPTCELSQLPAGEYYWYQLTDLNVVTVDGQILGKVERLIETGANDVLVVISDPDSEEILIPYIRGDVVKEVDLDQQLMIVDWQTDFK